MKKALLKLTSVAMAAVMFLGMASLDSSDVFAGSRKHKAKKPGIVNLVSVKMKKPSYKYQKLRVNIKWKKKGKYRKYQIYRKIGNGKWKKIKTVKLSKKAKTGKYLAKVKIKKTYRFKVRALNGKVKGTFSRKLKITIPNGVKIGKDMYLIGDYSLDDRSYLHVKPTVTDPKFDVDKVRGTTELTITGEGSIKIGDTLDHAKEVFGDHSRCIASEYNYNWYIFNAVTRKSSFNRTKVDEADWGHVVWLGVYKNKVVAFFTVADDWKLTEDGKVVAQCGMPDENEYSIDSRNSYITTYADRFIPNSGTYGRMYGVMATKKVYNNKTKTWQYYSDFSSDREPSAAYMNDATLYIINGIRHQYNSINYDGISDRPMLVFHEYLNESAEIKANYLSSLDYIPSDPHSVDGYTLVHCYELVRNNHNIKYYEGTSGSAENLATNGRLNPFCAVNAYMSEIGTTPGTTGHRGAILRKKFCQYGAYNATVGAKWQCMHFSCDFVPVFND